MDSDDFMMDDLDDFSSGTPEPAQPPTQTIPSGSQRLRAGRDMISIRYRLKQFLSHGGGEILLVIGILAAFWLLLVPPFRHVAAPYTGPEALPLLLSKISSTHIASALFSLFFTFGTAYFLFLSLREIASPEAGIAAALLLAVIPAFLSSSLFMYRAALAQFLGTLSMFFLFRNINRKSTPISILAGFTTMTAMATCPEFLPMLIVLPLAALARTPNKKGIPFFLIGAVMALLVVEVLLQSLLGHSAFDGFRPLYVRGSVAGNPPGAYFLKLFTAPGLAPFALIAVFALGYTARAGTAVFPIQPAIFFLISYLLLDLFPLGFSPYRTFPSNNAALALPLASLGGMFLGNLLDRSALRWLAFAVILPALAALLLRL